MNSKSEKGGRIYQTPALVPKRWTTERTAALGGVLQSALHGYTEGAISVTTGLVTLISRFVLQVCELCRRGDIIQDAVHRLEPGPGCLSAARSMQMCSYALQDSSDRMRGLRNHTLDSDPSQFPG